MTPLASPEEPRPLTADERKGMVRFHALTRRLKEATAPRSEEAEAADRVIDLLLDRVGRYEATVVALETQTLPKAWCEICQTYSAVSDGSCDLVCETCSLVVITFERDLSQPRSSEDPPQPQDVAK